LNSSFSVNLYYSTHREDIMSKSRIEDTARSFLAGNMSRRAFIARMSRLGVGAAASAGVLSAVANRAWAQDFNWRKHAGKTIKVLLPKHPYATYLTQILPAFTELTGIRVEHDTLPEGPFFEKKTSELNTRSATYDAFMDGIMFAWGELLAGQIADLNEFIGDPGATSPAYNWEGILPNMRASCAWSGIPGDRLGGPGSRQMLVPLGWEGYCVSYNREIFDAAGESAGHARDLSQNQARCRRQRARHQRARRGQLGHHSSRLLVRFHQLRRPGFPRRKRQDSRLDEQPPGQGIHPVVD